MLLVYLNVSVCEKIVILLGCLKRIRHDPVICKSPTPNGDILCNGAYCLPVTDSKSYCICTFDKNGPGCQEDKSGQCSAATGNQFFQLILFSH